MPQGLHIWEVFMGRKKEGFIFHTAIPAVWSWEPDELASIEIPLMDLHMERSDRNLGVRTKSFPTAL